MLIITATVFVCVCWDQNMIWNETGKLGTRQILMQQDIDKQYLHTHFPYHLWILQHKRYCKCNLENRKITMHIAHMFRRPNSNLSSVVDGDRKGSHSSLYITG